MSRTTILAGMIWLFVPIGTATAAWPPQGGAGVAICDAPGKPNLPVSAPDGSGGAYFAWLDSREFPVFRCFVQHVDGSGAVLWQDDGISIGTVPVAWERIAVADDGQGGAIVIWRDFRADTAGNLYANRLSPGGAFLWGATGVPVILGARHETFIAAAADGGGGVFVAWQDDRDSIATIRAQRLDANGNLLWPVDGVVVASSGAPQVQPRVAADGTGGVLVGWTEARTGLYDGGFAQRLDGAGTAQWATLGVSLTTSTLGVYVEAIAADGTGGALASWRDYRSQNLWAQAFAQRLDAGGNVAWDPSGESLSGTTFPVYGTTICSDGQGGAIVAWHNYEQAGWNAIVAQRISAAGARLWPGPGIEAARGYSDWMAMAMFPDGAGGAVFGWNAAPASGSAHSVYAQRIGPLGSALWTVGGTVLATLPNVAYQVRLAPDGTGGAVAGWIDSQGFGDGFSLAAQRVTGNGTLSVPGVPGSPAGLRCVPTPARASAGVELRFAQVPASEVRVRIFDLTGRLVRSLDRGAQTAAGVRWDGRDAAGATCAPGLYLASVEVGSVIARARLVLID